MQMIDLQKYLGKRGFYTGTCDGQYGPATRSALLACLKAGPDTPLQPADISAAAAQLSVTDAHVRTVRDVEAAGAGFQDGLPKVLFEGHIFSKLTGHKFDAGHPTISYPHWDKSKYPPTQEGRYNQILDAVALAPDEAFASASYGAFQIMGNNFRACGFNSPFEFVLAMCQSEGAQLFAFVAFLKANHLDAALRENRWADFARGYNGSAYAQNHYDVKLANAFAKEQAATPTTTSPPAQNGVISTPLLNVRNAPDANAQVVTVARQGTNVNILARIGNWLKVQFGPTTGFVLAQYVQ